MAKEVNMVHIQTQRFYERNTGDSHEITITFGHISPACGGKYEVTVDGKFYSDHGTKTKAYDEIVDLIRAQNWTPIRPL